MTYTYTYVYPEFIYLVQECDFETEPQKVAFFDFDTAKEYARLLSLKTSRMKMTEEWKDEFYKDKYPETIGSWFITYEDSSRYTEPPRTITFEAYRVMKFPVLREVPVVQ